MSGAASAELVSQESVLLATRAGRDEDAWDELRRRFHPVFVLWSRRYCNQIAHRLPPTSRSRYSCVGTQCDRAFWPAYEVLVVHVLGDRPGAEKQRAGRLADWATEPISNEEFSRRVTTSVSGGGRMSDVFRQWCSSLGLPQRARVPKGVDQPLHAALAAEVESRFSHLDAEAHARLTSPGVWLEALHWDAAQAGLTSEIDVDRVQRSLAGDVESIAGLHAAEFAELCHAVDSLVASLAPDFHADYLASAREITRAPVPLDDLTEGDLQEFADRGTWL